MGKKCKRSNQKVLLHSWHVAQNIRSGAQRNELLGIDSVDRISNSFQVVGQGDLFDVGMCGKICMAN